MMELYCTHHQVQSPFPLKPSPKWVKLDFSRTKPHVGAQGSTVCSWQLTEAQMSVTADYQFCFDATDSIGLQTERRCVLIKTSAPTTTTTTTEEPTTTTQEPTTTTTTTTQRQRIGSIWDCAIAVLDSPSAPSGFFRSTHVTNYGCAGRGTFDAFEATAGKQLDQADKAFYAWKKCYQCATGGDASLITAYDYDIINDSCGMKI